jgi:hypothetical protein
VTFIHVHNDPQRYRGEIVRIEGWLREVIRHEPDLQEKQAGVTDVYEVWLVNTKYAKKGKENPACLICTQLPEGIQVTDEVKGEVPVAFVGYFFKKYAYPGRDKKDYEVPLLIGHLVYKPKEKAKPEDWTRLLMPFFFAIVGGMFLFVVVVVWLSRRRGYRLPPGLDTGTPVFPTASETMAAESLSEEGSLSEKGSDPESQEGVRPLFGHDPEEQGGQTPFREEPEMQPPLEEERRI